MFNYIFERKSVEKGGEKEIKEMARKFYRYIKDAYRIQAGMGNAGTVVSIPLN